MGQLFISYARDDAGTAKLLAGALEEAGHSVWWDRRLTGGAEFTNEIEQALASADKVVVLWSPKSALSPWVRDEAAMGRDQQKLVPLSIENGEPPLGFRQYHTISLDGWIASGGALPSEVSAALGDETRSHRQMPTQRIRFHRATDGVSIAWSAVGEGPPLLKLSNWLNHLEHEWGHPMWQPWIDLASQGRRLLRYDQRGNGMSDWNIGELTMDRLVDDAVEIADAAGFEKFDLLALSQGTLFAVPFAVRHPERVRSLVIVNGFAAGWKHSPDSRIQAQWEAMMTLVRIGWGKSENAFHQLFTNLFFPDATSQQVQWWNELQRVSASSENAEKTLRFLGDANVFSQLKAIKVPTLVMHSRGDQVVPFDAGRAIAGRIPDAEFIALNSNNHLLLGTEPAWQTVRERIEEFLSRDAIG